MYGEIQKAFTTGDDRNAKVETNDTYGIGLPVAANAAYVNYALVPAIGRRLLFTLASLPITIADATGGWGTAKLFDFAEGRATIVGARANLTLLKNGSGIDDTFDGDFAMGTAAASSYSVAGTKSNIIPSTATPQAVAGATTAKGQFTITDAAALTDSSGGTGGATLTAIPATYDQAITRNNLASVAAQINLLVAKLTGFKALAIDGNSSAEDIYLNLLVDDADMTTGGTIYVSGTIEIDVIMMGDAA